MFEEYADKVRKWIKEEAYEFYERPDIETKLTIDIEENKYTIISIAFHKDSLDSIIIAANMEFNEKEQNMLKSLKNRNEIVWDIRKFLIQMHLDPRFPIITDNIKEIYFQKILFFDNLTKDRFFEVLTDISNSISFIRGTFLNLGQSSSKL
ncbi:MAG TPA: DUF2299 family protein [Nitrososphaeraceae archaeon]|jgi:hypothetical protein|nr:DUF2299 family protein [Nitrososphaeraceae archaeon]